VSPDKSPQEAMIVVPRTMAAYSKSGMAPNGYPATFFQKCPVNAMES